MCLLLMIYALLFAVLLLLAYNFMLTACSFYLIICRCRPCRACGHRTLYCGKSQIPLRYLVRSWSIALWNLALTCACVQLGTKQLSFIVLSEKNSSLFIWH